jgi:selenide, water dikinase
VLVGPESGDDAGVYRLDGHGLVATADFIPPVCDDPRRFGRIAATNSLSDVWAMGGEPLFALNLCTFPGDLPEGVAGEILAGGLEALVAAGGVLLGGHTVKDAETKYGLAVVGTVDPERILTLAGARVGQQVVLTKPLGTGVLVNAFKFDRLDAAGFEPALVEMERPNREAARLAREHDATAATDVTGFGLAGHAWNLARQSQVTLEIRFDELPAHEGFFDLVRGGVSTGCTKGNRAHAIAHFEISRALAAEQDELLFDPQTSGGLLVTLPAERTAGYLAALAASGHRAAAIGEVRDGPARLRLV